MNTFCKRGTMPDKGDPYRHHPRLRGKIISPETSRFRSLDLSDLDAQMRAQGLPEDWRRTDAERDACRMNTLQAHWGGDIWIFAYGSLMWDPAFHFSEVRRAYLSGYHRRFCLRSEVARGTPDCPGLMAGLDLGGTCNGLVFRVDADKLETESRFIWRREMLLGSYVPEFLTLTTKQGPVEAMAFVVNRDNPMLLPSLSLEETARRIAHAEGYLGPNIDYLENLAASFELLELADEELFRLRDLARRFRAART
ncbi:gamma-glutamylcyclotransferase [Labrenzia sp. CE80]|uniref:gamma-glutamylcyclotransferase n=1 Tax=Labrenzia sp. CE80 TaxID=1788986 RepID=UPI00129B7B3C|nr:gamma-glutamylcyclotransferase [Labrenzia sp. CE80]